MGRKCDLNQYEKGQISALFERGLSNCEIDHHLGWARGIIARFLAENLVVARKSKIN